jgi:hypothetical protein
MGRSRDRGNKSGRRSDESLGASALSENAFSVAHRIRVDRVTTCNYNVFRSVRLHARLALASLGWIQDPGDLNWHSVGTPDAEDPGRLEESNRLVGHYWFSSIVWMAGES